MKERKRDPFVLLISGLVLSSLVFAGVSSVGAEPPDGYTLYRALETALERNYDILRAKERIREQQGVVVVARARRLPTVDLSGDLSRTDENRLPSFEGQGFGSQDSWSTEVVVSETIYSGGRNSALHKREKLLEEASRRELEAVVNAVMFAVRERFYAVLLRRARVRVQEQLVELLEEELQTERARLKAGTVPSFNVLRAEVELANSRTPLIRARNELRLALEELARVMGLEAGQTTITVCGELTLEPYQVELREALELALAARPELLRLETLLSASEKGIDAAQAGYLPVLSAFGSYGAETSVFGSDFDDEDHGWRAGIRGSWNIFDSFGTKGRVSQSRAQSHEARLAYEQSRLDVTIEVRQAYSYYIESRELVTASGKVVEQAEESLRQAKVRFSAGAGIQLDVLNAQVALTEARTNEVQALYEYAVAVARLKRAVGG